MSPHQNHCSSYYAATSNDDSHYAALAGDHRTDVCVVGAGFTGLATALALAERGYAVTVLEQHRVGWGASGRNGGQLIGGMAGNASLQKFWGEDRAAEVFDLGYLGHDIIARNIDKYSIACDFKLGYADVAVKPRHLQEQQRWYEELCARGMESQVRQVDRQSMPALLGTDQYLGALVNMRNGHLHPLNLCLGEARAAAGLGVAIHENTEVLKIEHGPRPVVHSLQGRVSADFVVLAGNAYQQLEQARLGGLLFPASTYIVATEPLTTAEVAQINPKDLAVCDQNEIEDYFRLSADRRLLFGGQCHFSGRTPRSIEAAMLPRLRRVYPQLGAKRIDYAWGGKIGVVLNEIPLLGKLGDNVLYSLGYSGHGVNMTHACGEILADVVAGTSERMDVLAQVPHLRVPGGQVIRQQLVAMGMLYYRLRDLL